MRRRLEMQADRIEAVLASHRVPGRVWGGQVTPQELAAAVTPYYPSQVFDDQPYAGK